MATTPVEFRAPTGLTLTLELYAYGSDTIGNTGGDSATEATNRKGLYSANVTEALEGWYTAHVKSGSTVIAVYDVFMVDDTNVHRCTDRPQDQAQETVASVTGAVGSVTGAVGSVTGNVGGIAGTITTLDALDTAQDTQHSTTQSAISALNDLGTADIDARLAAIGLDHLVSTSVAGTDVADNSIVAKLVSSSATADWDDFVNTTDSLQAVRDRGDAAWTTATGFSTHTAADVRTEIDTNSTQLAAIVEDTNELQADWANGGRLDLLVDAILEDTGTTLPAAIPSAATITNSVLTTQMTESYAAAGAAPTLTQAVCWLYQDVQEAAVSGTTKTVKRLDQTTAAGTVTLDDANTPTSLTRAT